MMVENIRQPDFVPLQNEDYKLKFNPKKRCGRCEQLGTFSCEHNVFVRDSMRSSFKEKGFYDTPQKDIYNDISSFQRWQETHGAQNRENAKVGKMLKDASAQPYKQPYKTADERNDERIKNLFKTLPEPRINLNELKKEISKDQEKKDIYKEKKEKEIELKKERERLEKEKERLEKEKQKEAERIEKENKEQQASSEIDQMVKETTGIKTVNSSMASVTTNKTNSSDKNLKLPEIKQNNVNAEKTEKEKKGCIIS